MTLGDAFLFVPNAVGLLLGVFYTLSITPFADQQARRLRGCACGLDWPAELLPGTLHCVLQLRHIPAAWLLCTLSGEHARRLRTASCRCP